MRLFGCGVLAAAILAGCSAAQADVATLPAAQEQSQEVSQALPARIDLGLPYLGGPLPAGERLIRPMPQGEDARLLADLVANEEALAMRGSERWDKAARDADLGKDWFHNAFSQAAGHSLDTESAPALANLVRRAATDFGMSTGAVKEQFQRRRPFMVNGEGSCSPDDEDYLRTNGSYPSGHSAIGYGTAMVLASVFPDRAALLIERGRDFGDSRWVCNVHWKSDVEEGRAFAAATFARLQSDAGYQSDLAAARAEALRENYLENAND